MNTFASLVSLHLSGCPSNQIVRLI